MHFLPLLLTLLPLMAQARSFADQEDQIPYICSQLSPDNCMGVSLLDSQGPFPGQMLQMKSLNASLSSNSTLLINRVVWTMTNGSQLFLIRDTKNETTRRLFLGDRWPFQGQQGRVRETFLAKRRPLATVVEPLGQDQWGRVKINQTQWCLTITRCVKNDMGACKRDPSIRVTNESQITKGSYLKWTQCLNETHPSQWFFPLPPTSSPTPQPTLSPTTQTPTQPDETWSPTMEPTPEPTFEPSTPAPTLPPTSGESKKEYEEDEYRPKNNTLQPTQEPTLEPTPEPTSEPTTDPTTEPTTAPTSAPTPLPTSNPTAPPSTSAPLAENFVTWQEFGPYQGKLLC